MLPGTSGNILIEMLGNMLRIRHFEETVIRLADDKQFPGHFHVYIGQEATGVPALVQLRPGDLSFTTHRNHGHLLARGANPGRLLAEILGRATGYNRGRGGTLHASSADLGFPVTSAIVGGILPLATGAALAFQQMGTSSVSLALFGDVVMEEGAFYEAINIASLWKLPVIYLCENNSLEALGQAAGEYPSSTIAAKELTHVVDCFGIPTYLVDGGDTGAVFDAMREALDRARGGGGPVFIEARTVRSPANRPVWPALLMGELDVTMAWEDQRIPEEYQKWYREVDPILRFIRELLDMRHATREAIQELDQQVRDEIAQAVRFALESPFPAPEEALDQVFA